MRCLKLPYHFDPERLRGDLARVEPGEWIPHINKAHYEGEWSGAALRSIGGVANNLVPEARGQDRFEDTALLARCPYFREVLSQFRCPIKSARLLRLHAGSTIAEHVDRALDFEDGEVRLHIPVVTSDQVFFYLDGSRLVMASGECWYTNVNLPHSVKNSGALDRIHLVIDCGVDDWLRDLFARTPRSEPEGYVAALRAASAPDFPKLLGVFSAFAQSYQAGSAPVFRIEGATLMLAWRHEFSWQLRLVTRPANARDAEWSAQLESSPDPLGQRHADFSALVVALQAGLPGIEVAVVTSTPASPAIQRAAS